MLKKLTSVKTDVKENPPYNFIKPIFSWASYVVLWVPVF